jgi:hypothetical protein
MVLKEIEFSIAQYEYTRYLQDTGQSRGGEGAHEMSDAEFYFLQHHGPKPAAGPQATRALTTIGQ